jgi:gamma-glutamylcyclotransferase (GGCT)/AIG2-like uncharacterized protein YtfP
MTKGKAMSDARDHRLACYGTLAPGRSNHHQLAGLRGAWRTGSIAGRLMPEGWGASQGYPALLLDPPGQRVEIHLFESPELPLHWPRLDAFEGPGYVRTAVSIDTDDGPVEAWIYLGAGRP